MKLPFTAKSLGADLVSVSGHKIHAPKGIGALYIRAGLHLAPLIVGGSQEEGRRAGTRAMPEASAPSAGRAPCPGAHGRDPPAHGRAARNPQSGSWPKPQARRHRRGRRILCISCRATGQVLMNFLEARSVSLSRSSACKKGRAQPRPGGHAPARARHRQGAPARLSRYTTAAELDAFCAFLREARDAATA